VGEAVAAGPSAGRAGRPSDDGARVVRTADGVTATAFGKVNLSLHVGAVEADGYHPLRTIFQSLALAERVTVRATSSTPGRAPVPVRVTGTDADRVPTDASNLAVRAALALAARTGRDPRVALDVVKAVPVAGGMAGGSADAAATLLALDALWGTGLPRSDLLTLAAGLGADVPFTVLGGTAEGLGRGDRLTPLPATGTFHWVLAVREEGLSTAEVYRRFDAGGTPSSLAAGLDDELRAGLAAGDAARVGAHLHNDLQPVAVGLLPALGRTLDVAREVGAAGALVSGSGPTVAVLAHRADDVPGIVAALAEAGTSDRRIVTHGPAVPRGTARRGGQ